MKEWLEEVVDRIYVYDKDKVKVKVFLEVSINDPSLIMH